MIILIFILPLGIVVGGMICYYATIGKIEQRVLYTNKVMQCSGSLDDILNEIYKDAGRMCLDDSLLLFMNQSSILTDEARENGSKLMQRININLCESVYLYAKNSQYVLSSDIFGGNYVDRFADISWFDKAEKQNLIYREFTYGNKEYKYLSYIQPILQKRECIGYIVYNINMRSMKEKFMQILGNEDTILIINSDGNVIYSNSDQYMDKNISLFDEICNGLFSETHEGDRLLGNVIVQRSKDARTYAAVTSNKNTVVVMSTPKAALSKSGIYIIIAVGFGFIVLAMLLAFFIARRFYLQINKLLCLFQGVNENNETEKSNEHFDEIRYIRENIKLIIDKNENIENELNIRMKQLTKAQEKVIQSQLDSHFLLNTLQLVNMIIISVTHRQTEANYVINLLSELLQETMNTAKSMVTLEREVENTKKYLEIVNIRYGKSIDVTWNIPHELLHAYVLKLMLQPVVENAVSHGLRAKRGERKIAITAKKQKNDLYIIVEDNGVGISKEKVEELNRNMSESDTIWRETKIGLNNTNQRIRLIFGEKYGCEIESTQNDGTKVIIKMKYVEKN